ncbi:type II secretion system F family protein [Klebsiella sp. 2680]|uniref:type II secretion system F family protein n=1 Tax=Klebsiella sp. 2680 TaxID=2018037 RepID=UPI0011581220|nr:type II secretion system F family protein [Klebsiella sp. 2680]
MNPKLLNFLTILVFLSVLLVCLAAHYWKRQRQLRQQRERRLQLILDQSEAEAVAQSTDSILKETAATPFRQIPWLGTRLAILWDQLAFIGWRKTLRQRLVILLAISFAIGMAIGQRTPSPLAFGMSIAVLFAVVIGGVLFRSALQKHLRALRESLPDAIDAIVRAARAGVPVPNTFALVAEHLNGPLAHEFRAIDHWLKLGIPLRQVIQASAGRVPMAEYRFFVVILIINQEAGGRVGDTLERLAKTLRERRELALKVLSKTSESRASAKIVAALFPCCLAYMYFKSPEDFAFLFSDPVGTTVLIYAVCSVGLGMLVTFMMVRRIG